MAEAVMRAAGGFPVGRRTMSKKKRNGNREAKKPKQPKLPPQAATSVADLGKQQGLPGKRGGR